MTASVTAPRRRPAPATAPRPGPSPARRQPPLRVVPDGYRSPKARRRRARLLATLGVTAACAICFGLAAVHVLLAEGQFRLAHLQHQADDAQAQYVRLRLDVAQLESPERVVAEAQERLGMVVPTALTYLTPTGSVPVGAPATHAAGAGGTSAPPKTTRHTSDPTTGWAAAKPALSSHP